MALDPGWLLSSLAQSTAAVVAIVGGFLVSRLVQLSSEREGLRRQLQHTLDELAHVNKAYAAAHEYRRTNSEQAFFKWVIDDLAAANLDALDRDSLFEEYMPRGSSREELEPYLDTLIASLTSVRAKVQPLLRHGDTNEIDLEDLRDRGLRISDAEEVIYEAVVNAFAARLPERSIGQLSAALLRGAMIPSDPVGRAADLRRLDDSIRDEQQLRSGVASLVATRDRTITELELLGHPVGVTPAIIILTVYALLGIMCPVAVLASGLSALPAWASWSLVVAFAGGLAAVLAYIYWYSRSLKAPAKHGVTAGGGQA